MIEFNFHLIVPCMNFESILQEYGKDNSFFLFPFRQKKSGYQCLSRISFFRIKMDKIKSLVKGTLATEPIDVICWGQPTKETFESAVLEFKSSNREMKQGIFNRIFKKLNRNKNAQTTLAILHFVEYIIDSGNDITLGDQVPQIDLSQCENEKEKIADTKFVEMYYRFLRKTAEKPAQTLDIDETELMLSVPYCQIAIKAILDIVRKEFIINHSLKYSKHQIIIRMIASSILKKVSADLKLLNKFLKKYQDLIIEKHEFSFHINEIYEQVIFINKNFDKLKQLNRNSYQGLEFQPFHFNKDRNQEIEKEMMKRNEERKQFKSEREIKSMPILMEQNFIPQEIDENDILIQSQQFLM